jgi:hypothetical protein
LPELALDTNLIQTIQRDIAALGLVGEEIAAELLYLAGTSRLLAEPLRLIITGPSSSGKSEIPRRVVPMFPPTEVVRATSITPNALYYMEPGALEHKLIVAGERKHRADDEAADANAALRQLISEGRIVKVVTGKDAKGRLETKTIVQNGPVAYCETTTAGKSIFPEDLNRCLLLRTDDSREQTERVLRAVARRHSPFPERETVGPQAILDRHLEFQQSLEKCRVGIPFAAEVAAQMPTGRIEVRRVITQVMGTIEAIALLHQHQRGRDGEGELHAILSDYETARRLLLKALSESIGLSFKAKKNYELLKQRFPIGQFTTDQVQKGVGFKDKMACHRALKELEAMNVLRCVAKGKSHTPSLWEWTGLALDELLLPSVQTLFVTS